MVKIKLSYDDDFAPSSATVTISDPSILEVKGARLYLYNEHLLSEGDRIGLMEQVMAEAQALGCYRFDVPNALGWTKVDLDDCDAAIGRCIAVAEHYEEGSEAWVLLNCYLNVVLATQLANEGAKSSEIGERMFLVGASLRELELVRRNKRDALVRRSQKRNFGLNNEGRRVFNEHRGRKAQEWQRLALEIASETELTGSARAKWVSIQLERRHGIMRAHKTVSNFLAK